MKKKLISIIVLLVMLISALAPVISGVAYGATPEELKLLVPVAKSEVEANPSLYNLIAYQEIIKAAGYGEYSTQYQDYLTKRQAITNMATVTVIHEDEKSRKVLKEEKFDKVQAGKEVTYKSITIKDYKVVGKTEEKVTPKEGENIKIYFTYESVLDDKLYREIGQYNVDREMTKAELDKLKSGTVITPVINIPPTLPTVDVKLKSGKFLNGYPDGTFKPGSGLTRNEAAVLINNVVQSGSSPVNPTSSFVVDWAREAICKATSQTTPWLNLNTAVSPGRNLMGFRGDDSITREELAYALMSAYVQANNITVTASEGFSDTKGLASSDYIALGKAHGKLSGYPDGTFNPRGTITRAEATALVNGFVGNTPKQGKTSFSDVPENHWAAGHINAATK